MCSQRVNDWIRGSGVFDAVIDFDAALRDPEHPTRMAARFDSGDRLHPGDEGNRAMAQAVDLEAVLPGVGGTTGDTSKTLREGSIMLSSPDETRR